MQDLVASTANNLRGASKRNKIITSFPSATEQIHQKKFPSAFCPTSHIPNPILAEMSKYASSLQQQQLAILRQHSAQLEQQAAATAAAAAAAASDITNVNPAAKDDFMTAAGEEPDPDDDDDEDVGAMEGGERRRYFSKELRVLLYGHGDDQVRRH